MTTLRRSVMTIYSGKDDLHSHRIRIVLAEKAVSVDIRYVNPDSPPEDLLQLNPYTTLPTLIDRDLVLYQPNIIMEYLDERFPHPPLMPVYPVSRAKLRMMIYRIEQDWYPLADQIIYGNPKEKEAAKKELVDTLTSLIPLFKDTPYFLNEEFSLVDCSIAPILWRFQQLGIHLPAAAKLINQYAERVFARPGFIKSISQNQRQREATEA